MADERIPKRNLKYKPKDDIEALEKMEWLCQVGTGVMFHTRAVQLRTTGGPHCTRDTCLRVALNKVHISPPIN